MTQSKGTILIVDDEANALALLAGILTQEGYRVRPADSGKLALASVATAVPDLIMLDMRIGDMDGLEICRWLKSQDAMRDIPIMFISASAEPQERVEGLAMGAVDFVSKPFSREELLARVRTHLELATLRSQLESTVASRTRDLRDTVELLRKEVAEHRRTEQALRESEERFRNMADTAPVYIGVFDKDQCAIFFNRGWMDFTGRTAEQERGAGWTAGIHPDDLEVCLDALFSLKDTPERSGIEYRMRRADGEYRVFLATAAPRFAPDGTFAGHITSCIDITDLKRRQEAAIATQKLESLGVLASGIAHDFNNLLGAIVAQVDLLCLELENNVPALEIVKSINGLAVRAAEIVRQLMIYAGQEGAVLEQVDLASLVREMLELMKVSISKRAVLNVDLPEKLPFIQANAAQIRQVVMNLVTNASEALAGKDGVISVSLAQIQAQRDLFLDQAPGVPGGDLLRLEVSDTGCGMSQELQAGIFDPFFTTKTSGRGLGLSAVQGIIRRHGGTIRVESVLEAGSRFEILLPCVAKQELGPEIELPVSSVNGGSFRGTVLLVDDEDTLRVAVSKMLVKKGVAVFETSDGRKGVELFRDHAAQIDVVLLDVTLPGMSGPEVMAELRKIRPEVKVILTTAYGRDRALAVMGDEQSDAYIRKPYKINDLTNLLDVVCVDTSGYKTKASSGGQVQ